MTDTSNMISLMDALRMEPDEWMFKMNFEADKQ